jgi:hypothetical protein
MVFIKLIEDFIMLFPKDVELKRYKRGALLYKQFNTRKPFNVFKEYSVAFRSKIEQKDESFFINNNYNEIAEVSKSNDIQMFIQKIKMLWNQISETNRGKVWEYLILLCKITDKNETKDPKLFAV